jgi:hypothetical protein
MTSISVDQWINIGASTLATIACLAFIVTYHAKAPWWRSDIGRNLMAFAAAVGLLCTYTVLASLYPDGLLLIILRAVRTITVLAIATLMVQRTRLLLQAQREPSGD